MKSSHLSTCVFHTGCAFVIRVNESNLYWFMTQNKLSLMICRQYNNSSSPTPAVYFVVNTLVIFSVKPKATVPLGLTCVSLNLAVQTER